MSKCLDGGGLTSVFTWGRKYQGTERFNLRCATGRPARHRLGVAESERGALTPEVTLLVNSSRRQRLRQANGLEEGALKGDLEKSKGRRSVGGRVQAGPWPGAPPQPGAQRASGHGRAWPARATGLH